VTPEAFVQILRQTLEINARPESAPAMAAYMKNRFSFLGLKRPEWEPLVFPLFADAPTDEAGLGESARLLWAQPEREFVYVSAALLKKKSKTLTPETLELLEELIPQKAWWDSVDALTCHVLGPLVLKFPELQTQMDRWSECENLWLRRAAILHQLGHKKRTNTERLFGYCRANAAHEDFFIRKAIGWSLRTYAYTDPVAVRVFVHENREALSPLSLREAMKHLS
jgi:3-methyladenine DNA glycosylase AlkD